MIQQNVPLLVVHVDGSVQAAILVAVSGNHLRSVVPGEGDVVEFKWEKGQWKAENGEPVEIQFEVPPEEFSRRALAAIRREPAFSDPTPAISVQQARARAAANERASRWSN